MLTCFSNHPVLYLFSSLFAEPQFTHKEMVSHLGLSAPSFQVLDLWQSSQEHWFYWTAGKAPHGIDLVSLTKSSIPLCLIVNSILLLDRHCVSSANHTSELTKSVISILTTVLKCARLLGCTYCRGSYSHCQCHCQSDKLCCMICSWSFVSWLRALPLCVCVCL